MFLLVTDLHLSCHNFSVMYSIVVWKIVNMLLLYICVLFVHILHCVFCVLAIFLQPSHI